MRADLQEFGSGSRITTSKSHESFGFPVSIKFIFTLYYSLLGASLVAQMVKNLPAMQETWVRSLGPEDALEKGM